MIFAMRIYSPGEGGADVDDTWAGDDDGSFGPKEEDGGEEEEEGPGGGAEEASLAACGARAVWLFNMQSAKPAIGFCLRRRTLSPPCTLIAVAADSIKKSGVGVTWT